MKLLQMIMNCLFLSELHLGEHLEPAEDAHKCVHLLSTRELVLDVWIVFQRELEVGNRGDTWPNTNNSIRKPEKI